MFHITKRVYIDTDFRATQHYHFIIASSRWHKHPITTANQFLDSQHDDFDALLEAEYGGELEHFWQALLLEERKLMIYLEPQVILRLQIQYWKSIFPEITDEALYRLHASYVEAMRLRAYAGGLAQWDPGSNCSRVNDGVLLEQTLLTPQEFKTLADTITPSAVLQAMDRTQVGFEYLLAGNYAAGGTDAEVKTELLERVKYISWDNWTEELYHLRLEILSAGQDIAKLDPSVRLKRGSIEAAIRHSKLLSWTLDPQLDQGAQYIRDTYDYAIFLTLFDRVAYLSGDISQENVVQVENAFLMKEVADLLYSDDYAGLLERDIARGFRVSYCTDRFLAKTNYVFATWVYEMIRQNQGEQLRPYRLT